jgi:exopolysaccharide biosynthesis polyprenyl glycosylphosphotransferase
LYQPSADSSNATERLRRPRPERRRRVTPRTNTQDFYAHPAVTPRTIERRARTYKLALAGADVIAAAFALAFVLTTLGDDLLKPTLLAALPLVVVVGKLRRLYDRDELLLSKHTLGEAPVLFELATLYTLIIWFAGPLLVVGNLGRHQGIALWLILLASMLTCRHFARALARRLTPAERCAIIGSPEDCARIRAKIDGNRSIAAEVAVTVPVRSGHLGRRPSDAAGEPWPIEDLVRLVSDHQVERLILAPAQGDAGDMADVMRSAKMIGLHVSVVPRMFEVVGSQVEFDDLEGMTVLGLRRFELSRSSKRVKRALDLAGSGLGLLVLSPVLAAVALAIKLEARGGPVFFRQVRIGRDGKVFRIYKFRSMVVDAEGLREDLLGLNETVGLFKIAEDPRITRVGRFIRRTSLDELPQLINVLRGEMSLVGPRPLIAEEDELVQGWDRRRLHLTPGMTGHWQILGSSRIPLREMVKIDYLYVTGWSLWTDIQILLRTVPYVLARRGL